MVCAKLLLLGLLCKCLIVLKSTGRIADVWVCSQVWQSQRIHTWAITHNSNCTVIVVRGSGAGDGLLCRMMKVALPQRQTAASTLCTPQKAQLSFPARPKRQDLALKRLPNATLHRSQSDGGNIFRITRRMITSWRHLLVRKR